VRSAAAGRDRGWHRLPGTPVRGRAGKALPATRAPLRRDRASGGATFVAVMQAADLLDCDDLA
jgi:hypothetical protein